MSDRVPYLASRLQGFGTTIFAEMSALAVETGSVNLGQGFPDTDGPPEVLEAAIDAIRSGQNQYPPGPGTPELRHAIAEHQRHWYGLEFDPDTEILVTAGATEAIASALLSLCEPGDEVIMLEPYYDSYAACIAMAGATHRLVQLSPPGYTFDADALRAAVTPRTRLLLINSPHNPTGKVLSREELTTIAEVCIEHDLIAVTDEVYEHIVFDGEHIPLATLPGMRDRVVTISSGGKSFSCTGWKIGWVCASAPLVTAVRTAKQFLTYVNGGPFQHAIAVGLALPDERINALGIELREKRDRLTAGLMSAGLTVYPSAGTYFVTVDIRSVGEHDGYAFCRSLPERCGVVAVPNVVFYDDVAAGSPLVCFA
ncbi:MAG TPA: pyridoxal phosphate-dependent aminotransferase, partial [Acidimicrobiales bacterium]|nr:pyridoxal phosphate-dependent aminotransferase [Acidimicrobiales bacterium]